MTSIMFPVLIVATVLPYSVLITVGETSGLWEQNGVFPKRTF